VGRAVEDDARQARVNLVQRHQLHLFLSSCNVQHATCNVQRATRAIVTAASGPIGSCRNPSPLPHVCSGASAAVAHVMAPIHSVQSRSVCPSRGGPSICPRDATSVSVLPRARMRARVHACV
jgi:hypothetical protein